MIGVGRCTGAMQIDLPSNFKIISCSMVRNTKKETTHKIYKTRKARDVLFIVVRFVPPNNNSRQPAAIVAHVMHQVGLGNRIAIGKDLKIVQCDV